MFFKNLKILSHHFTYDYSDNKLEKFNIIYGITENFLLGAVVSMESIIKNNLDMPLNFHFFIEKISHQNLNKLEQTSKLYQQTVSIYLIDNTNLSFLPVTERWPYATYYRIIGFDILSFKYNTALYLDADIICKGDLSTLSVLDLNEYYIAAVSDLESLQIRAKTFAIVTDAKYFNSGVMLANLKNWKKDQLTLNFFNLLHDTKNQSLFPDQDILNIITRNKILYLNKNYNCFYEIDSEIKSKNIYAYKDKITDEVKLIHYVGISKPWYDWVNYPSIKFFREIYQNSQWSTVPLEKASTSIQQKKKFSHKRLQKKYYASFISYIVYILFKIRNFINFQCYR
ncbi:General stress protein A [Candidatus Hartigia pinicola]|nr:General stress protein A [Candidatus Hartigia pinicola]